jgi:acetyltransferase-like isoleucine patch superfamily enzyme
MSAGSSIRRAARQAMTEPLWRVSMRGRALEPYRRWQFESFGKRSIVHRPNWIYGPHKISVGEAVLVMPGSWLAVERQAWGIEGPVLRIGDRVAMRTNCTLSAACAIVIEDDVVLGGGVTVVDSDHTWDAGHPSVLYNPLDTAPVRIGRGSWIGDRVAVLKGSRIGEFCLIGANSVVRGEIPDHSVAVGAPARVVGSTATGSDPAQSVASLRP